MDKGMTFETKYFTKYMSEDIKLEIEELVLESQRCELSHPTFEEELKRYYETVKIKDGETIRRYTCYEYKFINAILRGTWNYEEHGKYTEEKAQELTEYAEELSSLIDLFPRTNRTFMVYRGTTLREFKKYGINTLEDLLELKGKYLYEKGFTSTSIEESSSFYNKPNGLGVIRNIEVKYIIPEGSQDGIPLLKDEVSYAKTEMEYLINKGSLARVIDAKIEGNNAIITAVLIPKQLWNRQEKVDEVNHQK